jgi:hypothetical protein
MSHEIIDINPKHAHDAIHDMESFWWIVVHLALTRAGPGKRRIVSPGSSLEKALIEYFDGDIRTLMFTKGSVFNRSYDQTSSTMEEELLSNFHEYFEPIKPVVKKWWMILRSGFEFRGYELADIHNMVLNILRDAVESLPDTDGDVTEREIKRRKIYDEETKKAIRHQTHARSYPRSSPGAEKMNRPGVVAERQDPVSPTPNAKRAKVQ